MTSDERRATSDERGVRSDRESKRERESKKERERESVKWKSDLRRNLSQRECVGRVIKCTQQLCDKGNKCARVQQCEVYVRSNTPLSWANFVPMLTSALTVAENQKFLGTTHIAFLRHLLTNPLEHGDAIGQHDLGTRILTDVHVALHDASISTTGTC